MFLRLGPQPEFFKDLLIDGTLSPCHHSVVTETQEFCSVTLLGYVHCHKLPINADAEFLGSQTVHMHLRNWVAVGFL